MQDLIEHPAANENPFDALRSTREDGTEYWSARDLQGLLGYAKWERFNEAVERAQQTARNMGREKVEEHFPGAGKTQKSQNQHGEIDIIVKDYHLTRYAVYLSTNEESGGIEVLKIANDSAEIDNLIGRIIHFKKSARKW